MESPLSFFRMHWDHEPRQLVGRGVLTAPRLGGLGTSSSSSSKTSRPIENEDERAVHGEPHEFDLVH